MTTQTQLLARAFPPANRENGPEERPPLLRATLSRRERIDDLRQRRAFYNWLGKRKKVARIDAELVPLMNEELAHEVAAAQQQHLVEQVGRDLMWIAGQEKVA